MPTTDASSTARPAGIWAMPEASRQLAIKARDEIINPAHEQLEKIQSEFDEETAEVRQAIAAVQTKAVEIAENLEKTLAKAGSLLASNKMSVSAPTLTPLSSSPSPTSENVLGALRQKLSSRKHISEAERDLQSNREIVHSVLEKTKLPGNQMWPDSEGLGCLFGICILLAGGLGAGLFISLAGVRPSESGPAGFGGFIVMALVVYVITMVIRFVAPKNTLKSGYEQVVENTIRARRHLESAIAESRNEAKKPLADAENTRRQALASLKSRLSPLVKKRHEHFSEFAHASGFAGAKWNDARWSEWQMSVDPEFGARFGQVESISDRVSEEFPELSLPLTLPALLPFADGRGLLFFAPASHRELAAHAVQSLLARLLATIPAGKLRLTFLDPISLGGHVAAFMALADHEETLINSRAWTEPQHIEERLAEITEHMETVIQKYLRTEYKTIHDYNAAAEEVAEPFRFVVVFDFPVNFTETAVRRLVSIARNGARCGVYVIIVRDPAKPLPYGFEMSELEQLCEIIEPFDFSQSAEEKQVESSGYREESRSQTDVRVGEIYKGTVFDVDNESIGVEIIPDKIGVVFPWEFGALSDAMPEVGESIWVKCLSTNDDGVFTLSHKAAIEDRQHATESDGEKYASPATFAPKGSKNGNGSFQWRSDAFQGTWRLIPDAAPPTDLLSAIIQHVGEQAKEGMRVEVPYDKLLALANLGAETWWTENTIKSIRVPLGPTGARKLQFLTLGEGMGHHALIVGRPGSGKSNLMHVIITTLALTYSPDEMRVYLIDFKKGVEFKSYADHKLPHAEAIAVESEREFGLSVVERLDVELKKRGDLFRAVGAANITEYREKTAVQIPRVLLLVDEFQEFFTQDDHVARQTTLVLDRLVRQGRAFGIHIILGSQTLAGSYNLSRSTLDQMAVRIAMQCSEADSRLILSDDNPAARLLARPGEAIYNAASGLVEGNNMFQVARFSEEDRDERLKLIAKIALESGKPVPVPIIFEGNELAHLADCRKLAELLVANDWPTKKGVELLLGDPIAIRDPIAARIRRQSGSNLLILSRDEAEGVGMCVASILSIIAQQRPCNARVFIADFTLADSEWAERAEEIEEFFPHDVKVLSRQKDVAEAVKSIADEVKRRVEAPPEESSIFLVLQGMQRMKVLRAEDESFSYENESSTPSELFAAILRDGPEVGVHVIAWCDTFPNAGRVVSRRMMTEFGLRAGGVMSADDSQGYFDDSVASKIDKPHRLVFFDEERPGQLDKFRPYSMPPREWLEMTGIKLRDRTNSQT